MAMEPITLFSRTVDPAGVARLLRELHPRVEIDGPDDDWRNAVVSFQKGKQKQTLTFTHDPEYYAEPGWSQQMSGMRGYFAQFPDTDRKQRVMMLTTTLKFSLGTLFEPDFDPAGDQRLEVLFAVTDWLDGVLFTPSSLRDSQARILFGAGGEDEEDPEAAWPRVAAEVSIDDPAGAAMHEQSRPKSADEADENAQPPTAERVARRALALTALTARAIMEQSADSPGTAESHRDLFEWIEETGIGDELEPEEWEVLQRPLGKLDEQMQTDATWRLEGLVILAWALGKFKIPPHDQLIDVDSLWDSLGLSNTDRALELLDRPKLRSREEIAALRNRLFALHWRMRNFHINSEVLDFAEFARTCWFGPLDITGLPLAGGDLSIGGRRLDQAPEEEQSSVHSAAQERHQAANWLWEGPEIYSEASVAT
jgi:uncharacterized protein DUF4272